MQHTCWSMNKSPLLSIQVALFLLKGKQANLKNRALITDMYMPMKFLESGCTSLNLDFGPYCFLLHLLAQTGCYGSQKGCFLTCRPKKAHCFLLG